MNRIAPEGKIDYNETMQKITELHLAQLHTLINKGLIKGAEVLNSLLSSHIDLEAPNVKVISYMEFTAEAALKSDLPLSSVNMRYHGGITGMAELIFSMSAALKLVTTLTGDDFDKAQFDVLKEGTLCEIGNVVINAVMGTISNTLKIQLKYSVPSYFEGPRTELLSCPENMNETMIEKDSVIILAQTFFKVKSLKTEGDIALFFNMKSFDELLAVLSINSQ